MTVLITLSGVGSSAGPTFNLYASPDGITFTTIIEGINKTVLEAGYTATVPDGTTDIKVTSVGQCTNSYVATIGVIPTTTTTTTASALLICGIWNSITQSQTYYDENNNPVTYQLLVITGGSQFDFYKLFLPGEIIDTASSTVKVLSYTAQTATNLIANSSELPAPDPQWEDVLFETTDNNTIYKYSVALNIWVSVPYGQETTTYNVDPVTWQINFDYTPPYIGTIGDPLASESPSRVQNTNIHPVLTMTLGGNLVTTDGRVIPINYTSTYTSILQEFESESNDCQNFRPTITGNICGTWSSTMNPMGNNTWESLVSGSVDFSSVLNGETISTTEGFTNIQLNSYKSIDLNIYSASPSISTSDDSNMVDFNFTNLQGTDDKPVDTLYFTGRIYTDAGRILNVNITSQYGLFIPGTSGGGTSYAQLCQ